MSRLLESEEAARRLGVKRSTLYAYVSRGRLASYPGGPGRRRLFDADEVEALARRARRERPGGTRLATVTTAVTQLHDPGGPSYRGVPATKLAREASFEQVAARLWDVPGPEGPWAPVPLSLPDGLAPADRLRLALVLCGAADPLRSDRRPAAVCRAAGTVTATLARAAGPGPGPDGPRPVAEVLAGSLGASGPAAVRAVEGAMILLADHELATSTLAVRLAASTRADLYDAFSAGLAVVAGPLHGGASREAAALLAEALAQGPAPALDRSLRSGRPPGFGHTVYRRSDARYGALRDLVAPLAPPGLLEVLAELEALVEAHDLGPANVDLGLAALMAAAGLAEEAGQTLFTVARLAGWTAHYLEELGEPPLRFRARAVYARPG